MSEIEQTQLVTSDGVELSLLEAGSGSPLMMLPGWSQTAAMFRHQLKGLSDRYRVIALDWRGHGHSQKVAHGYRLSRFAMDLHEVIEALNLESVAVLSHSMGNGVLWCHRDLTWDGSARVGKNNTSDLSTRLGDVTGSGRVHAIEFLESHATVILGHGTISRSAIIPLL